MTPFLWSLCPPLAHAGAVHALLIGVGDYPENSGWADLNAASDVEVMAETLSSMGVEHVHRLEGRSADRQGVVAAIETHLRAPAIEGDPMS